MFLYSFLFVYFHASVFLSNQQTTVIRWHMVYIVLFNFFPSAWDPFDDDTPTNDTVCGAVYIYIVRRNLLPNDLVIIYLFYFGPSVFLAVVEYTHFADKMNVCIYISKITCVVTRLVWMLERMDLLILHFIRYLNVFTVPNSIPIKYRLNLITFLLHIASWSGVLWILCLEFVCLKPKAQCLSCYRNLISINFCAYSSNIYTDLEAQIGLIKLIQLKETWHYLNLKLG